MTGAYTKYCLNDSREFGGQLKCKINLYDTWGFDDSNYQSGEFALMLDGRLPSSWKMKQEGEFALQNDPRLKKNPTLEDKMHCVIFVVNAEDIQTSTQRFDLFKQEIDKRKIQCLVALPKIDCLDETLDETPENYCQSDPVLDVISELRTTLKVDMNEIFPLKNYERERFKKKPVDSLALSLLDYSLEKANDFFDKISIQYRDFKMDPPHHNPVDEDPKDRLAAQSARQYDAENYAGAYQTALDLLALDENNEHGLLYFVRSAEKLRKFREAAEKASLLVHRYSQQEYSILLARILFHDDQPEKSMDILNLLSSSNEVLEMKARCHEKMCNFQEAHDTYSRINNEEGKARLNSLITEIQQFEIDINGDEPRKVYKRTEALLNLYPKSADIFYYRVLAANAIFKKDDYSILPDIFLDYTSLFKTKYPSFCSHLD